MLRYLGVISGTSMDAIDVVTLVVEDGQLNTVGFYSLEYPATLRHTLEELCHPENRSIENELECAASADVELGKLIATAIGNALHRQNLSPGDIVAIGSHGQNIRHRPYGDHPFSLQIGNPAFIAEQTGITTVANFRMSDIAAGGQGAPLAPGFHQAAFESDSASRCILNLGGIGNITLLGKGACIGYDTGPANTLMDQWCQLHTSEPFDRDGNWAMTGNVISPLLEQLLADRYFGQPYPKSTGREHFNLLWLTNKLGKPNQYQPEDVQRTLLELSAQSIANEINRHQPDEVYSCGGGVNNPALIQRIADLLIPPLKGTTATLGIHPQHVEGAAFAWFAHCTLNHRPSNIPTVTGARRPKILGGIYYP